MLSRDLYYEVLPNVTSDCWVTACCVLSLIISSLFMVLFRFIRTTTRRLNICSYKLLKNSVKSVDMCKELKTKILRLSPENCDDLTSQYHEWAEVLQSTVTALKAGQVVAVPTDTIYGLACVAQNSEAVRRVYDIKGRNEDKALAICVGDIQDIHRYCKVSVKEELLRDLLPGPVTLVLERSDFLNTDLNPFTNLIGVRIPDYPFLRCICQMCAEPLALTSANISSHTSTVAVQEFEDLWPSLAVVVDGGPIGDKTRLGSTVVDLSVSGRYRVIRPGCALSETVKILEGKYGLLEHSLSQ